MSINWESSSGLDYGEQLYTPRGSQGAGVGSYLTDRSSVNPSSLNDTMILTVQTAQSSKYFRKRPVWTAMNVPAFTMKDKSGGTPTFLTSLPVYNNLMGLQISLNESKWERIVIELKDK